MLRSSFLSGLTRCSFVAGSLHPLSYFEPMLLLLPLPTDELVERRRFPSSFSTGFHFLAAAPTTLGETTALTRREEARRAAPAAAATAVGTRVLCVGVAVLLSKDRVLVFAGVLGVAGEGGFLV